MKVIKEHKLHLIYTIDDNWQEKANTKLHMRAKGYEVHDEYLSTVDGLERVVTVFSKEIWIKILFYARGVKYGWYANF